jgi:hypothetical protein
VLPSPAVAYFNDEGRMDYAQYIQALDLIIAAVISGNLPALVNASNDTQAKQRGVLLGQMYRNGSVLMVRVA